MIPGFRGGWHREEARRADHAEASGILRTVPAAVAVPEDAEDVAALVRWAARTGMPLVPRGAGTGMPGGNVGPGVAVDMVSRLGGIGRVDAERGRVRVEPGAVLAAVNEAAAEHGLHFPVDPSSAPRCTVGGIVANNSGGAHGVLHGATREWTEGVEGILADGASFETRRGEAERHPALAAILDPLDEWLAGERDAILAAWPRVRKNSSGYALREYLESGDAVDLLVGSEGTLAILTAAALRLAPIPARRGLALLEFRSLEDAGAAVERLLPLGVATCEMLDRTFIDLVRSGDEDPGYPLKPGLEAILLVEVEGATEEDVRAALERVRAATEGAAAHATLAVDEDEQARLWHVRHAASPLIAKLAGERISMQFIEDGVVPVDRLPEYVRLLRRVLDRHGLPAVIFGHAGDGNLHVNPLVDVSKPGWRDEVEGIVREVAEGVAALGGTMAGEHGDGRLRAPVLETVWGAEMVARFRRMKDAFDPRGILNPGVILPQPGQKPLEGVRW